LELMGSGRPLQLLLLRQNLLHPQAL
jgi:hypothetical protein